MAQTIAQVRPREQRPPTFDRAVEAIGQDAPDPIRGLLLQRGALERLIGLRKGGGTSVLSVAQMPEHPTTDNRRQIHFVGQTAAVLLIGQEIGGEGQTTPGQHHHETVMAERADQTIQGHWREMTDHRAELQTEPTVCGQQGITGDLRSHLTVPQDEVRQDREDRFAPRALDAPDGEPTQTDPDVMRVRVRHPPPLQVALCFS